MSLDIEAVLAKLRSAELPTLMDVAIDGPNVKGRSFGDTPLHIIATWGDVESARVLIESGAEIDARGEDDFTPLLNAVEQGHLHLVALLLNMGANPLLRDKDGMTARDLADRLGRPEIKKLFDDLSAT